MKKSVYEAFFKNDAGFAFSINKFAEKAELTTPFYRKWFPDNEINATSFDAFINSNNFAVAAAVTGWNSSAPLSGDEKMAKKHIESLIIQRGKTRTEKELTDIRHSILTGNMSIIQREFYNDVAFCKTSVDLAQNALVLQLLSTGKATLTAANNEGGAPTGVILDYGIGADQKKSASISWATSATADPISDIETVVNNAYESQGITFSKILMGRTTINKMLACDKVKAATVTMPVTNGKTVNYSNYRVSLEDFNLILLRYNLPIIEEVPEKVRMESAKGTRGMVQVWAQDICTFITNDLQGSFNYSKPIEEIDGAMGTLIASLDTVTIKQSYDDDPVLQKTIGKKIGAPAWEQAGEVILFDATPA